jgi:hypothetical protein
VLVALRQVAPQDAEVDGRGRVPDQNFDRILRGNSVARKLRAREGEGCSELCDHYALM